MASIETAAAGTSSIRPIGTSPKGLPSAASCSLARRTIRLHAADLFQRGDHRKHQPHLLRLLRRAVLDGSRPQDGPHLRGEELRMLEREADASASP